MYRTLVSVALFAMMTAFAASKAHAVILTYTYTGNTFDFAVAPFTTSDRITGSFTIDCGLLGGAGDCSSLPYDVNHTPAITSFSFTVDGYTIDSADGFTVPSSPQTPGNSVSLPYVYLSTDVSSNVIYWDFWTTGMDGDHLLVIESTLFMVGSPPRFLATDAATGFFPVMDGREIFGGMLEDNPGRWTVSVVSEPSTLANVLVSLAALLFLLWRLRAWPVRVYRRPLAP